MDAHLLYQNLAVIAAFLLIYSLIAGRFESKLVNGPLLFLLTGWLLGPGGLELLSLSIDSAGIKLLAELTLVIVLFNDAANTNWQVLLANRQLPIRLLLIGLPLTLVCGALFGHWIFPTCHCWRWRSSPPFLPHRCSARQGSGQQPRGAGTCARRARSGERPQRRHLRACAASAAGPYRPHRAACRHSDAGYHPDTGGDRHWPAGRLCADRPHRPAAENLLSQWLATAALASAHHAGAGAALLCAGPDSRGSGFIAAFVGGLFIGHRLGEHKHAYMDSCEGYGDLLSVVIWMVFGATLMPILPELLHWQYWLYAIASLTLLRMVPVWLSLIGTGLKPELKLFIGWFGPRGLASIVFAVMVQQNEPALIGQRPIIATVLCTIILSVILHGLTANPWVERFKPR